MLKKARGYAKSFVAGYGVVFGTTANLLWAVLTLASDSSKLDKIANLCGAATAELLTYLGSKSLYESGVNDLYNAYLEEELNKDSE